MSDEPGFNVGDEFYRFPTSFRMGDPVLVAEVTGLGWNEFAELLDQGDPRTLAGLVAVAVWQKHPKWRRDRVLTYVEALELDDVVFDGGDEADALPPLLGDAAPTLPPPASSTPSSDTLVPSDVNPAPTGLLLSETSAA